MTRIDHLPPLESAVHVYIPNQKSNADPSAVNVSCAIHIEYTLGCIVMELVADNCDSQDLSDVFVLSRYTPSDLYTSHIL